MKRFLKVFTCLIALLICICMISCGNEGMTKIGIIQYVTDEALDNARNGIIEGLKEKGYIDGENITIKVYNPQANSSKLAQMTSQAVEECDCVFAIATPVAIELKGELKKQGKDIPAFFTAVTDPVFSGIMDDASKPTIITGTNDMNPIKEQISLAKELFPNKSNIKIGTIFSNETNSMIQVRKAEEECALIGATLIKKQITTESELSQATEDLISSGVDCIYLPTDNLVASNVTVVTSKTNDSKIPTICGEAGMVSKDGTITYGINYTELGKLTGQMAASVLSGEKTLAEIPCVGLTKFDLVINETVANSKDIAISEELLAKADSKK